METLKRFQWITLALALALTLAASAGARLLFDTQVAMGVLLGGGAGTVAFVLKTRSLSRVAFASPKRIQSSTVAWTLVGWGLYVAVLFKAYRADPETLHAFAATAAGLFIVRLVVMFLGVTNLDQKAQGDLEADGKHR